MSYLHISQGAAEWIVSLHLSRWLPLRGARPPRRRPRLLLPPVSIIL